MLNNAPAKAAESREGLNFTDVLRECLPSAVVAVDFEEKLSGFSPAAEKLIGLRVGQVLGQSLGVLPPPLHEIIERTFQERKPQIREITLPAGGQGEVAVHVSTCLIRSEKPDRFGVVAVLHDLSLARMLEQHLRHLDCLASIGTLSTSMAHEIKNALVAVKTFLDLLIQQNKDADLAQIANRELRRADSIISQMLRFAGPAKPTFNSLHLHDVLEHSLRVVEHQLAGKKIRLKKSLAASPDLVRGDSYQLEQAVLNVLFNAIEAMGPDGELAVTTELVDAGPPSPGAAGAPPDTQLCLSIKDSGIGIPPENISRLFDPFFTTKTKGTGLGLSITRRIIQEHHGSIGVESEPNQGTTFTLLLPCA